MEPVCVKKGKLSAKLRKEFWECFQWVAGKKGWEGLAWPARMRVLSILPFQCSYSTPRGRAVKGSSERDRKKGAARGMPVAKSESDQHPSDEDLSPEARGGEFSGEMGV